MVTEIKTKSPVTDIWLDATWDEYIERVADPIYDAAKCYYYNQQLRIQMAPVGFDHAECNGILPIFINLFCLVQKLRTRLLINCSYRKPGLREAQPDLSYYLVTSDRQIPSGSSPVNLDQYDPPELAIEISDTSLATDLGEKRMLYEELGVKEYWVVDVKKSKIIAFKIVSNNGSQKMTQSEILPDLEMTLLEAGLRQSKQMDNTELSNWFLTQIKGST